MTIKERGIAIKKISGQLLFDRRRVVRSFQISIAFLVIFFVFVSLGYFSLLFNDPYDPIFSMSDPLTIFLIMLFCTFTYSFALYIILYCLNFYIFQRRITFKINKSNGHLSIIQSGKLALNTQDYQYSSDYHWIGSRNACNIFGRTLYIFRGSAFFHLHIETNSTKYDFYERIDTKHPLNTINVGEPRGMNINLLRTTKRHPSFINEVYEELKRIKRMNYE